MRYLLCWVPQKQLTSINVDKNRRSFRNVAFSSSLEFLMTDKVLKPRDSECHQNPSDSTTTEMLHVQRSTEMNLLRSSSDTSVITTKMNNE
jgi:hypothetical protein